MGMYVDTPTPPDPKVTAATQTNSNVNTAIANTVMGNANTNTPTGSVKYTQIGTQKISDGNGGMIDVPRYQSDQTLSPEQQQLYNQQTQLGSSMNNLAQSQIDRLQGVLGQPLDTSGLPRGTSSVSPTPLQTSFGPAGGIQSSVNLNTNAPTTFGQTAGKVDYGIDPTSGSIQYGVGADDFSKDRTKVEDAIFSRLQPQQDRDMAAMQSRLANQGITPGSQAWNTAMDALTRANTDARMQAILAGGQEQSRMFGMDVTKGQFNNAAQGQEFGQNQTRTAAQNAAQAQDFGQQQGRGIFAQTGIGQNNAAALQAGQFANSAQQQNYSQLQDRANFGNAATQQNFANNVTAGNFNNTARQQALQMLLAERNQPINEVGALMSGGQVSMPQFQPFNAGAVAGTPVGQYINDNYNTQAQQAAATNAGIFSALGSVAGMGARGLFASDRRLKKDIERIGTYPNGLPVYGFTYKLGGPRQIGFMADEVEQYMPDAVVEIDGYKHVNYAMAVH